MRRKRAWTSVGRDVFYTFCAYLSCPAEELFGTRTSFFLEEYEGASPAEDCLEWRLRFYDKFVEHPRRLGPQAATGEVGFTMSSAWLPATATSMARLT